MKEHNQSTNSDQSEQSHLDMEHTGSEPAGIDTITPDTVIYENNFNEIGRYYFKFIVASLSSQFCHCRLVS